MEDSFTSRPGEAGVPEVLWTGVAVFALTIVLAVIVCLPYYILLIHVHESKVICSRNVYF